MQISRAAEPRAARGGEPCSVSPSPSPCLDTESLSGLEGEMERVKARRRRRQRVALFRLATLVKLLQLLELVQKLEEHESLQTDKVFKELDALGEKTRCLRKRVALRSKRLAFEHDEEATEALKAACHAKRL